MIAWTPASPRGYGLDALEARRRPRWRRARFCARCRTPVARDRIAPLCAACLESEREEARLEREDGLGACLCWWDEASEGRSVCGIPCPEHSLEVRP